jgi:uncharacterized glyoxalase superfamily protein PhnB
MKIISLTPELIVSDVKKSINFYSGLGFQKIEGDSHWAKLKAGSSQIMLMSKSDFDQEITTLSRPENKGWGLIMIEVDNIDELYSQIKNQVKIHLDLHSTDYGTKEFTIEDLDSYLIQFTEREHV